MIGEAGELQAMERSYHGEQLVWWMGWTYVWQYGRKYNPRAHTCTYSALILPAKAMISGVRGHSRPDERDEWGLPASGYHPYVSYTTDHRENGSKVQPYPQYGSGFGHKPMTGMRVKRTVRIHQ